MMKLIILLSVIVGYSTTEGCEDEVSELHKFSDLLGVFHVEKCGDRYTIPTRDEGRLMCEKYGGWLASKADVELVRKNNGYNNCHCGWMSDAVAYPNVEDRSPEGCGKVNQMNDCPEDPSKWNRDGWNVYCTRNCDDRHDVTPFNGGTIFGLDKCGERYMIESLEEGEQICQRNDAVVATYDQVKEAMETAGFSVCHCGWFPDGKVGYPTVGEKEGCGKADSMNFCPLDFTQWGREGWNVFCYKA